MKRCTLASTLLSFLVAASPALRAADAPLPTASATRSETIVLRVRVNTQDKGDVFVERTGPDFLVKVQDLRSMGFQDPAGAITTIDGEPYMSLASIRGVTFEFEEKTLALNITADPRLLPRHSFATQGQLRRGRGTVPTGSSGFFNYALTTTGGTARRTTGLSAEAGWRSGDYLLLSNWNSTQNSDGTRKLARLMTSVTRDDREQLQRIVIGDFFTPSRDFSAGVNLGGVSFSKLYALNPYFVRFPMQSVGGTAALPSDLEVYLDGQRIRSEKIQPGQFQVSDIIAYQGARNVQVVLRDAFGRVQQLDYSFYFSDQALQQGLHEYSYNLGAMRRRYGIDSDAYGPLAFSMFHRYGLNDRLTFGARAEGTKQMINAGPLATLVGGAGTVSMAVAGSALRGRYGSSVLLSYSYRANTWSAGASLRHDAREYATIGDPPAVTNRRTEGNLTASYYLPGRGTVSLSHSLLTTRDLPAAADSTTRPFSVLLLEPSRATSLNYGLPLFSGKATLSASLSRIKDSVSHRGRTEAYVAMIVFLDRNYSLSANHRGSGGAHTESVQFTKNQPVGEGLGFLLSGDRSSDSTGQTRQDRSTVQFNAPAAVLRADVGHVRDQLGRSTEDYRASAAGGVGFAGGNIAFGRPITDSFGIVQVGRLPGVEVSLNGMPIGKTDARGQLFVPTLAPYFDNEVSIATENVPLDYVIPATIKAISPSLRGGALVEFAVSRLHAFSGRLTYTEAGLSRPVEFQPISILGLGPKEYLQTGRNGTFYLENLKPGAYEAAVEVRGKRCSFALVIPQSEDTFVDLGEIVCRLSP